MTKKRGGCDFKGAMASSVDYEIFVGSGLTVKGAIDAVADSS